MGLQNIIFALYDIHMYIAFIISATPIYYA